MLRALIFKGERGVMDDRTVKIVIFTKKSVVFFICYRKVAYHRPYNYFALIYAGFALNCPKNVTHAPYIPIISSAVCATVSPLVSMTFSSEEK